MKGPPLQFWGRNSIPHYRSGLVAPMERASVATDGDSRTAMDGAKCPLEWVSQDLAEQLRNELFFNYSIKEVERAIIPGSRDA